MMMLILVDQFGVQCLNTHSHSISPYSFGVCVGARSNRKRTLIGKNVEAKVGGKPWKGTG